MFWDLVLNRYELSHKNKTEKGEPNVWVSPQIMSTWSSCGRKIEIESMFWDLALNRNELSHKNKTEKGEPNVWVSPQMFSHQSRIKTVSL